MGSPPHTWRTQPRQLVNNLVIGITSTYVENTKIHYLKNSFIEDHLHIRGEHSASPSRELDTIGSPPHTWRTLRHEDALKIIVKDHLHIRGEHSKVRSSSDLDLGSPPHTWRTRLQNYQQKWNCRITSTYVENT